MAVDEARQERAAGPVDRICRVRIVVERGDQPVPGGYGAGLEHQLGSPIVAEIGQPVLGQQQHLRGVAHGDRAGRAHSSIGTRTPRSRATAIASG